MAKVNSPRLLVSTRVEPQDSPQKVAAAVQKLFPDWVAEPKLPDDETFPVKRNSLRVSCEGCAPDRLLEQIGKQRILDTALDVMSQNLRGDAAWFLLSLQAASAGKVSFTLPDEGENAGSIRIEMEGEGLAEWLEDVTWHSGRDLIPRSVADDKRMHTDGSPGEWFDAKGRPTINKDEESLD